MAKPGRGTVKTPMGRVKYTRTKAGVHFTFKGDTFILPAYKLTEFASIDEAVCNTIMEEEGYE